MLDVAAYLARIAYRGPTEPTAETLRGIHHAHLLSLPFENLDIPLGRRILLDEAAILRKVIEQRRGGFCYELNGAFAARHRYLDSRPRCFRRVLPETRAAKALNSIT